MRIRLFGKNASVAPDVVDRSVFHRTLLCASRRRHILMTLMIQPCLLGAVPAASSRFDWADDHRPGSSAPRLRSASGIAAVPRLGHGVRLIGSDRERSRSTPQLREERPEPGGVSHKSLRRHSRESGRLRLPFGSRRRRPTRPLDVADIRHRPTGSTNCRTIGANAALRNRCWLARRSPCVQEKQEFARGRSNCSDRHGARRACSASRIWSGLECSGLERGFLLRRFVWKQEMCTQ
jgi:hypothetical protein